MEEVKPVFTRQHELLVSIETLMNKMEPVIVERFFWKNQMTNIIEFMEFSD